MGDGGRVNRGVGGWVDRKKNPPKYPHSVQCFRLIQVQNVLLENEPRCYPFHSIPEKITTEASILFAPQFDFLIRSCPVAQSNIKLQEGNRPLLLFVPPRPLLPLEGDMAQAPILGLPPFSLTAPK